MVSVPIALEPEPTGVVAVGGTGTTGGFPEGGPGLGTDGTSGRTKV